MLRSQFQYQIIRKGKKMKRLLYIRKGKKERKDKEQEKAFLQHYYFKTNYVNIP